MKRKQSETLEQECKVMTEVETSTEDPDIILVSDQSTTNVLLKQERQEAPLINKEKRQRLYSDLPLTEGMSSVHQQKQAPPMEELSPGVEHEVISVNGSCKITSLLTMSSQNTSTKETVRKLICNLREILLYFVPESQLIPECGYASVEELIGSLELEQSPEKTNEKLKMCFDQIQNVFLAQYEKQLKKRVQSIIYDSNRRGILNEVYLMQSEHKRKLTEEKLNNLRAKLVLLLEKLQLGCPAGDLEQIDAYLEALLNNDTRP